MVRITEHARPVVVDRSRHQPQAAGPQFCERPPKARFAPDSPLEETGFEPSVPRQEKWSMPNSSDQTRVGRTLTLGGGTESSLEGRDIELSVSPKDIRTSPYDLCANRSDRRQSREGDRWFESISLRRRVTTNSEMRVEAAQPTAWSYDARQLRRFAHAPTRGQRKSAQRARSNRAHLHDLGDVMPEHVLDPRLECRGRARTARAGTLHVEINDAVFEIVKDDVAAILRDCRAHAGL